jgi:Tfp pilus assembly protein PilF
VKAPRPAVSGRRDNTMDRLSQRQRAAELFGQAYESQLRGDLDEALRLYSSSIESWPTAEAHTFRGWTYSALGDYDRAIAECVRAIELDPAYGNPYNDIGAYLIEKGHLTEAQEWIERALQAPRYEHAHFAHFNLGRIFERRRRYRHAAQSYRRALELKPGYSAAAQALTRLRATWN